MTDKPLLLDLFCCAGGAGEGYRRAGFDVIGMDIEVRASNPSRVILQDVTDPSFITRLVRERLVDGRPISAVHASPPCQRFSTMTPSPDKHPDYIQQVRDLVTDLGVPFVIENVPAAPLLDPIKLCGSAFGLAVRRHRMFEVNFQTPPPPVCNHKAQGVPIGVYGSHPDTRQFMRPNGKSRGRRAASVAEAQRAMGIDWISDFRELAEAIPPAYTEWIGKYMMEAVNE